MANRPKSQWRRNTLACLALAVGYVAFPITTDSGLWTTVARAVLAVAMLVVIVLAIRRQVVRLLHEPDAPLGGLLICVLSGLAFFALADYAVAFHRPSQFEGLRTRLDALYFSLTTLLTVGFGDVVARGQLARGLVCVQMFFNITLLAGAMSLLSRRFADRARRRS